MEQDTSSYNKIRRATNEELTEMWTRYFADHENKELRDALILQYIYLTKYVVGRVKAYEKEEMINKKERMRKRL